MLINLAIVSCIICGSLLLLWHGFWLADQRLEENSSNNIANQDWPEVVAIIPARNEATIISHSLPTVLRQNYPGQFSIVLVDDNSCDGTAEEAKTIAKMADGMTIEVVQTTSTPDGWSGKLWAVTSGLQLADELAPKARYILLTDADIAHESWVLQALVCKAEVESLHLVSVMAMLRCDSGWERLLVPSFMFFFQKLYPFQAVNNPYNTKAGAAGGCILVRRDTLRSVGNLVLIRDHTIDDYALGRLIKAQGPIWLGLSTAVHSLRPYDSLSRIWTMITRTAFAQLEYRISRLISTLLGMWITYLVGPIALTTGVVNSAWDMVVVGAVAWALMCIAYRPTLMLYCRPQWEILILPVAAFFYVLMTVDFVLRFWLGYRSQLRGRCIPTSSDLQLLVRTVARQAQTSFFWAMALLGREQREAMFAIYAFCRAVDDITDEISDRTEQRAGLALWREELKLLYNGQQPHHPIAVALEVAARRFSLRYEDCAAIIDGMEMDVEGPLRAPSFETLDVYCDRVASAVGRLSVRVFGLATAEGERLSYAMGRALQLTNILRDISEDAERGRLYLPRELLEAHSIAANLVPVEVLHHPALPQVCSALGAIASLYFTETEQILADCPRRRAKAASLMEAVYKSYLIHLKTDGFQHPRQRIHLSRREKLSLILRYMLV